MGRALVVHPGFLFVSSLALAGVTQRYVPLPVATRLEALPVRIGLALLFAAAILLFAWCFRTFRRHATPVEPGSWPAALITDGPFRFSRNPMYTTLLAISLALAVVAGSLWFFAATATLAAILDRIVIPREEKVMSAAFGEAYERYRSLVRRWV
ncbi:MAG TPA: isoprenylcysteine carboxylmethyltransferase family protein [Thermoanaerobaculia bacterium]|nr:isoprenylcysteine carboxylmethyltransferase family protein [Thermoanaerobaculia bacterium]